MRRTSLAILGRLTPGGIDEIASICADSLGWDEARMNGEKTRSLRTLESELGISFTQSTQ